MRVARRFRSSVSARGGLSFFPLFLLAGFLLGAALIATGGCSPPAESLIVATSGDYPPFSQIRKSTADLPEGYGPDLIRAYARDRGLEIQFVPFRWPALLQDLRAERFDVAVGGITIRPERILAGRFSVPVAQSGAIALVDNASPWREISELDQPAVRIAVNRGGHLERVTRERFPRAQIFAVDDNGRVLDELITGRVDAVVTDTLEAPLWQIEAPATRALGPFTQDRKAFLLPPDRTDLASDLDTWLMARAEAGDLSQWRTRALGPQHAQPEPALPWPALLAALDARLSLMPAVAEAKRRSGAPVEDPEREQRVLAAAVARIQTNAPAQGFNRNEERKKALLLLFRAQIEAAKAVQIATLAQPPSPEFEDAPPDLDQVLRPALIRIGEQISQRVVSLPPDIDPQMIRQNLQDSLADYALEERLVEELVAGLLAVAQSNAPPDVQ